MSSLWIPLFCAYFPLQWALRVLRGKRKRVKISQAIHEAHARETPAPQPEALQ